MLTMSTTQMDALAISAGQRFEQRLLRFVQSSFAEQAEQMEAAGSEPGAVLRFVSACIERAEALAIEDDADTAVFAALVLAHTGFGAEKAEVLGWTKEMLDRKDLPGGLRIDWIFSRLQDFADDDADAATALKCLHEARKGFRA